MLRPIKQVAPDDIFSSLPLGNAIKALAQSQPVAVKAHHRLYRAAWNVASVLPDTVNKFYRFGPPPSIVSAPGPIPYWWLYVADEAMTCIYEAGFCGHDARQPGSFYIEAHAVERGLIAIMDFPTELRLLDLTGDVAFTMGVYDLLSSTDHRWCQWFAYQLQAEGELSSKMSLRGTTRSFSRARPASVPADPSGV